MQLCINQYCLSMWTVSNWYCFAFFAPPPKAKIKMTPPSPMCSQLQDGLLHQCIYELQNELCSLCCRVASLARVHHGFFDPYLEQGSPSQIIMWWVSPWLSIYQGLSECLWQTNCKFHLLVLPVYHTEGVKNLPFGSCWYSLWGPWYPTGRYKPC